MVKILDVAKLAGVSKGTVSRCLREDPTFSINEETKKKIFDAAEKLGYKIKPTKIISAKRKIMVIHRDSKMRDQIDNAYYLTVRNGIEETCYKKQITVNFIPFSLVHDTDFNVDGVIICGNFEPQDMVEIYEKAGKVPCSFVGKNNHLKYDVDWISFDVNDCVDLVVRNLYSSNHKNVLYVGGYDVPGTSEEYQVKTCFLKKCKEFNIDVIDSIEGRHTFSSGYELTKQWFENRKTKLPTALFASNDPIAIGAMKALQDMNINIPADISVIGLNGDATTEVLSPSLSTVDVHANEMGAESVLAIIDRLENNRIITKRTVLQPYFLNRDSVAKI